MSVNGTYPSRHFSIPWGGVFLANRQNGSRIKDIPTFGRSTEPWKLFSVTVSLTRYWACSTAQFVITRPILSEDQKNVDIRQELAALGIAPEEAICIELGYAKTPFSDEPSDIDRQNTDRVFFGYIDTINVKMSSKGVKVTLSCRDSMRFLIDNKFTGQVFVRGQNPVINQKMGLDDRRAGPNLKPLELPELQSYLEGSDLNNVLNLTQEQRTVLEQAQAAQPGNPDLANMITGVLGRHKIIAWLIYTGSNGEAYPGFVAEWDNDFDDSVPVIEASTRLIATSSEGASTIQGFHIMNRFPIEVIKHVGSLEAEPRELYSHMETGRICWRKRTTYRWENPWLFSFLKEVDGVEPNIISAEVDWSTVGAISEILVVNPESESNASSVAAPGSGVLNVGGRLPDNRFFPDLISKAFPGLAHFPRRTRYIFDDTISNTDLTNAIHLVDAMLRIWGKDIRAGNIVIPGNALIRTADAIRLFNIGFFNGDKFRVEALVHKMIAQGPSKGFRTQLSFAEPDESARERIADVTAELGNDFLINEGNGLDANGAGRATAGDNAVKVTTLQDNDDAFGAFQGGAK